MQEMTFKLAQKAILRIKPAHTNQPSFRLLEFLQGIIYDSLRSEHAFEANWERFCTYDQEGTPDKTKRILTGSLYDETDRQLRQWAMKLTYRDALVRRRKWQLHIGIDLKDANSAILYYALMYSDHMAGSFSSHKPPFISSPPFLSSLNQNPRLLCCCGSYQLPPGAIAIDEQNFQSVVSILRDPMRELPVVIIGCPDLVSPSLAEKMLVGNAVVCWLDDMDLLESLNDALSPQVYMEWDSIQVVLPQVAEQSQHLGFSVADVSRLGRDAVLAMLRQAYCESLRGEERRSFVTVDDIFRQRDRQFSLHLQKQLADTTSECNRLHAEISALKAETDAKHSQAGDADSKTSERELADCEALLNEALEQYDSLRSGVLNLTQRLYGSIGQSFVPDEKGEACLCDLERSIFVNLAAKQGKQ